MKKEIKNTENTKISKISFVRLFLNKQNASAYFYGIFGIIAIAYDVFFNLVEAFSVKDDEKALILMSKLIVLFIGLIADFTMYIVSILEKGVNNEP